MRRCVGRATWDRPLFTLTLDRHIAREVPWSCLSCFMASRRATICRQKAICEELPRQGAGRLSLKSERHMCGHKSNLEVAWKFPRLPRRFPGPPQRSTPLSGKPDIHWWLTESSSELDFQVDQTQEKLHVQLLWTVLNDVQSFGQTVWGKSNL